jgi:ADP-heptose:LPS heptosyltransferase
MTRLPPDIHEPTASEGPPGPTVLVARLDNMGDVLLSGPAVRAIAQTARVVYVCSPSSRPAAELLPGIDRIIEFRAEWVEAEPEPVKAQPVASFLIEVRRAAIDEAVILTSFHQSPLPLALLLRLAGVHRVAGISDDYPGSLLDVRHRVNDDVHEVTRSLSLVEVAGYPLAPPDDPRLRIRAKRPATIELPERFVALHPSASVPARAWSPSTTAAVAAALVEAGQQVVVTGGPGDLEAADRVGRIDASIINLAGGTDLAQLAHVLERASALVCGNTGPAHLAAAVGTPVVSIFAPTVPANRWRPWMVPHVLLGQQDIACAGCRARLCPLEGHPCIESILPGDVVDAVNSLAPDARSPRMRVALP